MEEVIELSSKFSNDVVLSEALIWSCYWGSLNKVKWLMEHIAADINYKSKEWPFNTPLTAACINDHLDIVKYLVETCHADFNLPDGQGYTPLTWVCRYVSMSVSMYLLCEVSDLNVNIADSNGNTALHWAVWFSKDSRTQLHKERFYNAALYGRLEEVIELSSKFSNDVKVLSEALIKSCYWGRLNKVKWLMEHTAADVTYKSEGWPYTPLTIACDRDHLEIVKYLVETCHAAVNLPNSEGNTPMTRACRYVRMSVSMYLLCEVSDLDVNIADRDGNTALHWAVWCSKDSGYTQLHKACGGVYSNATKVLELVYVRGHKINVQDNRGSTPLHYACRDGYSDIVETLMLEGADETITNDEGKTPAEVAESRRHRELLKLLDRNSLWQVMLRRN